MTSIPYQQLIYGRVERPLSTDRFSGYQTVAQSPGMTPELANEIQERISMNSNNTASYWLRRTDDGEIPVMWSYFSAESGACFGVAKTACLRDRELLDANGRTAPITQCVVIDERAFRRLRWDPFYLIDLDQSGVESPVFFRTANDLVNLKQAADSNNFLSIPLERFTAREIGPLSRSGDELRMILKRLHAVSHDSTPIRLVGGGETVMSFMRELIGTAGPQERRRATFTTIPSPEDKTGYWGQLGESGGGRAMIDVERVDAWQPEEHEDEGGDESGGSFFFNLWRRETPGIDAAQVPRQLPTVLMMDQAIAPPSHATPSAAAIDAAAHEVDFDDDLYQWLFSAGGDRLLAAVDHALQSRLTDGLARSVTDFLHATSEPRHFLAIAGEAASGFQGPTLCELLFQWFLSRGEAHRSFVQKADWRTLAALAGDHGHAGLGFVASKLGLRNRKTQAATLRALSERQFIACLQQVVGILPLDMVCESRATLLLTHAPFWKLTDEQLADLLRAVFAMRIRLPAAIDLLWPRVARMTPTLKKRISKQVPSDAPPELRLIKELRVR
ncbi:MAG: hypothetical protein AAGJ46_12765 [Planctomycetota bacterium]